MLVNKYRRRFYRKWIHTNDLFRQHLCVEETDLDILSDIALKGSFLKEKVLFYRQQIKDYILKDKRFLVALKPLSVSIDAPKIIKDMAEASKVAGVGPMAAVAGAVAQYLGEDILREGAKEVIIENGGDIFLEIKKMRVVGIYAGETKFSGRLFLKIRPQVGVRGICTSSATVSHSLSFGNADAVTILAKDAILADAVATSACNRIKTELDFEKAVDFVKKIRGVLGIVVILKDKLASWGKAIEFVEKGGKGYAHG
ncbi:MAG: UPF0280 family protein [Candidatus Omnitrophica bacterium]|nr:UPF0280 family protein [Candidatus Omnitrophota bacterium]